MGFFNKFGDFLRCANCKCITKAEWEGQRLASILLTRLGSHSLFFHSLYPFLTALSTSSSVLPAIFWNKLARVHHLPENDCCNQFEFNKSSSDKQKEGGINRKPQSYREENNNRQKEKKLVWSGMRKSKMWGRKTNEVRIFTFTKCKIWIKKITKRTVPELFQKKMKLLFFKTAEEALINLNYMAFTRIEKLQQRKS